MHNLFSCIKSLSGKFDKNTVAFKNLCLYFINMKRKRKITKHDISVDGNGVYLMIPVH